MHIMKKIYLKNYVTPESDGWIIGGYAFLWFHYIVGLGICLSCSHLSDLTLTIAANIYWSLFNNVFKTYYIFFTNKHLNTDQLTRFMIFHYFAPCFYLYFIQLHVLFCHESWDSDSGENTYEDKSGSYISWFYDAFLKEIQDAWYWVGLVFMYFWFHHFQAHTVNYFFFERWNISELDEMRFYGVAPHWYFRPLMGLLVVSPTHYEGLMWMILYFGLLAFIPVVYNWYNKNYKHVPVIPMQNSKLQTFLFIIFMFGFCYFLSFFFIGVPVGPPTLRPAATPLRHRSDCQEPKLSTFSVRSDRPKPSGGARTPSTRRCLRQEMARLRALRLSPECQLSLARLGSYVGLPPVSRRCPSLQGRLATLLSRSRRTRMRARSTCMS
jgi:quinol-cytochrome oxidoreductase complex cytochrome b subunit